MRVLLIEDDRKAAKLLAKGLQEEGFVIDVALTGEDGEEQATVNEYDVIVLDWLLPGKDGLAVCRALRARDVSTPILMLTARDSLADRVSGLSIGADDYLTKPFGGGELLARLRVLLRRAPAGEEAGRVRFGAVEVDFSRRAVTKAGEAVKLSAKEYALLRMLCAHRGKVLTHRQILRELWGPKAEEQTHYLRVYMTHLRQKLEDTPNQPKYFKTESGIGYRLMAE